MRVWLSLLATLIFALPGFCADAPAPLRLVGTIPLPNSKTIGFGSTRGSLDSTTRKQDVKPRYNLILTLQIRNLTNRNNPGPIIGNITSPLFGRSNQAAGSPSQSGTTFSEAANNRRLEFQTRFIF
jgi:hypothetical protein